MTISHAENAVNGASAPVRAPRKPEPYCNELDSLDDFPLNKTTEAILDTLSDEEVADRLDQYRRLNDLLAKTASESGLTGRGFASLAEELDTVGQVVAWLSEYSDRRAARSRKFHLVDWSDDPDQPDTTDTNDGYEEDDYDEDEAQEVRRSILMDADRAGDYRRRLEHRRQGQGCAGIAGAATGLPQLDAATGGLQGITVLAGRPQAGKTSLAVQMCIASLSRDPKLAVVYFMVDNMSNDELFDQMVCHVAGVDLAKYLGGTLSPEDASKVETANAWLDQHVRSRMATFNGPPNDPRGQGLTCARMLHQCQMVKERTGTERVLVVIDLLHDLPLPHVTGTCDDAAREHWEKYVRKVEADADSWRIEQVVELSTESRQVCPEGWPVLVLCKLRKSASGRGEPELEDLLGPVDLGYKAKRVFFLLPEAGADANATAVPVTLAVKKARHAASVRLPLRFHVSQFRFEERQAAPVKAAPGGLRKASPKTPASSGGTIVAKIDPLAGLEP